MKIGLITDAMDEKIKVGAGNFTYNLVKNLLELDKKNEYILIHYKKSNIDLYKKTKELLISCPEIPYINFLIKNFLIVPSRIKKENFDIIHSVGSIGPLTKNKQKTKIIQTIFDLVPLKYPKTHPWSTRIANKFFIPFSIKKKAIDYFITISKSSKQDIIDYYKISGDKIKITYPGLNKGYKQLKFNTNSFKKKYGITSGYILYVGMSEPKENISNLIKAFYLLIKKGYNESLVIVGKRGWDYKNLIKLVKKLKLQEKVIFTGYIPDKDLPLLYNAADLFVSIPFHDGWSLPICESMACGCPVIASDIKVFREITDSNSWIGVNPNNINEITIAMEKVLREPILKQKLIKNGLKRVKLFDWKKTAKETLSFYEKIMYD